MIEKKRRNLVSEVTSLRERVAFLGRRMAWLNERVGKLEGEQKEYKTTNYDCNPQMYALQRENYFLQQGIKKEEIEKYLLNKTKSNGKEH